MTPLACSRLGNASDRLNIQFDGVFETQHSSRPPSSFITHVVTQTGLVSELINKLRQATKPQFGVQKTATLIRKFSFKFDAVVISRAWTLSNRLPYCIRRIDSLTQVRKKTPHLFFWVVLFGRFLIFQGVVYFTCETNMRLVKILLAAV